MRAITLVQPWASAVVHLGKRIENRGPKSPCANIKNVKGKRVAIHAGLKYDPSSPDLGDRKTMPRGAVIGVVTVVDAVQGSAAVLDAVGGDLDQLISWYAGHDSVAVILSDVVALAEPVPCTGHLGWWRLPADVAAKVLEQIPRSVSGDFS